MPLSTMLFGLALFIVGLGVIAAVFVGLAFVGFVVQEKYGDIWATIAVAGIVVFLLVIGGVAARNSEEYQQKSTAITEPR